MQRCPGVWGENGSVSVYVIFPQARKKLSSPKTYSWTVTGSITWPEQCHMSCSVRDLRESWTPSRGHGDTFPFMCSPTMGGSLHAPGKVDLWMMLSSAN